MVRLSCVLIAMALSVPASADRSERPDVVLVIVDDLNDWVGYLGGHPQAKTPNLDRLVARGTAFTNAYCAAPSCAPSRASIFSGRTPPNTGIYTNLQWRSQEPNTQDIARTFRRNGYSTASAGKTGGGTNGHWDEAFVAFDTHGVGSHDRIEWEALSEGSEIMRDHLNVSWSIEVLARKRTRPLFLAVGLSKPHLPWNVPVEHFDERPTELPFRIEGDVEDLPARGRRVAGAGRFHDRFGDERVYKEAVGAYLAAISYMDQQLGRLLDALDASSSARNTIIMFVSDHGFMLGQKGHWKKFALWREATRVPLVVVAPGLVDAGATHEGVVSLVGVFPTLVALSGLESDDTFDDISFFEPTPGNRPRVAVTWMSPTQYSIRSESRTYIRYDDGGEELYDPRADPFELHNLAPRIAGQ